MEKEKELKVSPAMRKAAEKYLAQFVDLRVRLKPEEKQAVVEYAAQRGESINKLLLRLIREEMERDNGGEGASAPAANTETEVKE